MPYDYISEQRSQNDGHQYILSLAPLSSLPPSLVYAPLHRRLKALQVQLVQIFACLLLQTLKEIGRGGRGRTRYPPSHARNAFAAHPYPTTASNEERDGEGEDSGMALLLLVVGVLPLASEAVEQGMQWRGVCQGGLDEEQQEGEQEGEQEEGPMHAHHCCCCW